MSRQTHFVRKALREVLIKNRIIFVSTDQCLSRKLDENSSFVHFSVSQLERPPFSEEMWVTQRNVRIDDVGKFVFFSSIC